jgi:hypothetical protein
MRLNPAAFNRFLPMMGQSAIWRRGYACPCIDVYTGQPSHTCTSCEGKGRLWDDPVDAGRVGIVGRDLTAKWAQMGQYNAGDVLLSIPSSSPLYAIGPFDRVVLSDRSEPFSDALVPGHNTRLRAPVLSIDKVLWKDEAGALVDGPIPSIGMDGLSLEWGGDGPPEGVAVSITGRRMQEFFCYQDQPFDRPHHGGAALPRRIVLRRFDLFGTG